MRCDARRKRTRAEPLVVAPAVKRIVHWKEKKKKGFTCATTGAHPSESHWCSWAGPWQTWAGPKVEGVRTFQRLLRHQIPESRLQSIPRPPYKSRPRRRRPPLAGLPRWRGELAPTEGGGEPAPMEGAGESR